MFLGIDIGGTKIAVGAVDRDGGLQWRRQVPTPPGDAEDVFTAVRDVLTDLPADVAGVGIGCAGPVDPVAGTVAPLNIPGWRDFPLRDRVAELVPRVRVELAGDGLCMALGESWVGAGRDTPSMVGLVVSTGVGGGLVIDDQPHGGRTGNAGHLGHIVVEDDGELCSCGGKGCVETVASGPNLVRWARTAGWRAPDHADAAHLTAAARHGDEIARAAFDRGGRAVAKAIIATAVVVDLDLAVVGGGVAKAGDLLFAPIRAAIVEHARLPYLHHLRVVPAELGADAGVVGAARLVATP
ncbi:ROK family protein [Actinokineospora sp. NBRC 105648]|uniref:ROK family protein n=1 Tax=Actinokineospora sp. NBRC 105648 TaxID=3032206 RepID=UPI0024A4FA89|nr:ROK family protein [Actinokineospora sp. NBRC 105648]GLZ37476.1 sugar kinase [Actinokineospora sp. NBRC 105648]